MLRGSFFLITVALACDAAIVAPINTTCSGGEWKCRDGGCVAGSQRCDGELSCEDGSDEALLDCQGKERPMFGLILHCLSPWSGSSPGVCPDICHLQPNFCYYALLAAHGAAGTCRLPQFPNHGSYSITELDEVSGSTPVNFSLHFACNHGHVLEGDSKVRCENGTWTKDFPYCVEACELRVNETVYISECTKGSKKSPCARFVPTGSVARVQRRLAPAPTGTGAGAAVVFIACAAGGSFNISTGCIYEIDRFIATFETDTMKEIIRYQDNIGTMKNNSTQLDELNTEFDLFDNLVKGNLTELRKRLRECEIRLDLLSI